MSCCGGSPVSRSLREAKSLSVLLTRNWGVGVVGGASIAGMGVGVIGGMKSSGETWRWSAITLRAKSNTVAYFCTEGLYGSGTQGKVHFKGEKKSYVEGGREGKLVLFSGFFLCSLHIDPPTKVASHNKLAVQTRLAEFFQQLQSQGITHHKEGEGTHAVNPPFKAFVSRCPPELRRPEELRQPSPANFACSSTIHELLMLKNGTG